jgi:outer membrane protein OmpA-like peptidoglycan-associated protein
VKEKAKEQVDKIGDKKDAPKAAEAAKAATEEKDAPKGPASTSADPGEGAWANYDFVPGERVLFKEDFSGDRVGNFPKRFEFVDGAAEVVTWNGGKWLRAKDQAAIFGIPLPEVLPERFTIEFQMTMPWWGAAMWGGPGDGNPRDHGNTALHTWVVLGCCEVGFKTPRDGPESTTDARPRFASVLGEQGIDGHLFNVRIQADGKYMKLYLEDQRLANLPAADFMRGNKLYVSMRPSNENPVMFGNLSVNAGGREMYDALMADGRVVTQGILFDVDSDRIRPESTPTLNEIADMLKNHGDLRIRIEGHTDNTGEAAHNQTLSDQRAAAVKTYLSTKAGISASRLESQGFGPTRPAKPNETPEGRQANRRVELVKL